MPPVRERYNAKARGSTAGSSHKKKGKRREKDTTDSVQHDPNAEIVVPKSEDQKNAERKERLRQEVSGHKKLWIVANGTSVLYDSCLLNRTRN